MSSSKPTNEDIFDRLDKLRRELQQDREVLEEKIDRTYVRLQYFDSKVKPLERFIYGVVGVSLTSLLVAIIAVVLKSKQ